MLSDLIAVLLRIKLFDCISSSSSCSVCQAKSYLECLERSLLRLRAHLQHDVHAVYKCHQFFTSLQATSLADMFKDHWTTCHITHFALFCAWLIHIDFIVLCLCRLFSLISANVNATLLKPILVMSLEAQFCADQDFSALKCLAELRFSELLVKCICLP